MKNREYRKFIIEVLIYGVCIIGIISLVNYFVDASSVINPQHDKMAQLALEGNIVKQPENYNERVYQICIVDNMDEIPKTIVIGSSRGMYLGKEVTGYNDIYNNCVSGACIEDYYALLGLYYIKFNSVPKRVIIEVSPWVFYGENPEARWQESDKYRNSALYFYQIVSGQDKEIEIYEEKENPYISLPYFQYNIKQLYQQGLKVLEEDAKISDNSEEAAEYPDGTIRYSVELEKENSDRLQNVKNTKGVCNYQNSSNMVNLSDDKILEFNNLVSYLKKREVEIIIYTEPFSNTQCQYSFDMKLNEAYLLVNSYLNEYCEKNKIALIGNYDGRMYGLTDERFIDYMHLDKKGVDIVWNYK